jgi:hypothetical protein
VEVDWQSLFGSFFAMVRMKIKCRNPARVPKQRIMEIIAMNIPNEVAHDISHIFACPLGDFPIKYLGVPLHFDNLRREDTTSSLD